LSPAAGSPRAISLAVELTKNKMWRLWAASPRWIGGCQSSAATAKRALLRQHKGIPPLRRMPVAPARDRSRRSVTSAVGGLEHRSGRQRVRRVHAECKKAMSRAMVLHRTLAAPFEIRVRLELCPRATERSLLTPSATNACPQRAGDTAHRTDATTHRHTRDPTAAVGESIADRKGAIRHHGKPCRASCAPSPRASSLRTQRQRLR
jgi:hypothetical protein